MGGSFPKILKREKVYREKPWQVFFYKILDKSELNYSSSLLSIRDPF